MPPSKISFPSAMCSFGAPPQGFGVSSLKSVIRAVIIAGLRNARFGTSAWGQTATFNQMFGTQITATLQSYPKAPDVSAPAFDCGARGNVGCERICSALFDVNASIAICGRRNGRVGRQTPAPRSTSGLPRRLFFAIFFIQNHDVRKRHDNHLYGFLPPTPALVPPCELHALLFGVVALTFLPVSAGLFTRCLARANLAVVRILRCDIWRIPFQLRRHPAPSPPKPHIGGIASGAGIQPRLSGP